MTKLLFLGTLLLAASCSSTKCSESNDERVYIGDLPPNPFEPQSSKSSTK